MILEAARSSFLLLRIASQVKCSVGMKEPSMQFTEVSTSIGERSWSKDSAEATKRQSWTLKNYQISGSKLIIVWTQEVAGRSKTGRRLQMKES